MVRSGKPSRGCDVCRKRRIKCDEAEPSCSFCSQRNIPCPGPKSQFDVAWRDQNAAAEKGVQRRKKATEKADRDRVAAKQLSKCPSPSASNVLAQDFVEYAVSFFIPSYILVRGDDEVQRSFLDCLYPVWAQADATSPLKPAVAAVALCLFEAWTQLKSDSLLSPSQSQYLHSVQALRKRLQDTQVVGDDVLMASLMLEMYEGVRSFTTSSPKQSPHVSGTAALVSCRARQPISGALSQRVLLGARNQVVGTALGKGKSVPPNVSAWADKTNCIRKTPGFRLEVANVQASASQLFSDHPDLGLSALDTLKQAIDIDQRLVAWSDTVQAPIPVSGPACIPQSVQDAGLYQDYCDIYKNLFVANTLNVYRFSRIRIQLAILSCLIYLESEKNATASATAMEIIQEMTDATCASVPFYLGDRKTIARIDDRTVQYPQLPSLPVPDDHYAAAAAFGGWLLAERLGELLSLKVPLRAGQKQWLGGQMGRVKRVYNVRPPRQP